MCGPVPWAVLSAGVDHRLFLAQVEIGLAKGVIAGRSLRKDCIDLDRTVTRHHVETSAVPRLSEIQSVIQRHFRR